VVVGDRHGDSEEAKIFEVVASETTSELCIPIRLRGRVLWILNLEDPRRNAFNQQEIATLLRIVSEIDATLDRLFQGLVLSQILEVLPEAVVLSNTSGSMLICNESARALFEIGESLKECNLSQFLLGPDLSAALSEKVSPTRSTEVKGLRDKRTPVRMSKSLLPEEYDHVVLLLQDVTELRWETDVERLKAALAEAASQVRVPLSLISSFVQQIARKASDPVLAELASKSVRQLGRVELTYDRVFASYDANQFPSRYSVRVDIDRVLGHILDELPASDRKSVKVTPCDGSTFVLAEPYRLLFALESMLSYLLRSRADSNQIALRVFKPDSSHVEIAMTGRVEPADPSGDLEKMVEATRAQIALGGDSIRRIASESNGTFTREQKPNGRERLTMRLQLVV
jgi:PAS domain-containing protein